MKSKTILLLVLLSAARATGFGQSPYTLEQCIDSALRNNLNIRSAGFDLAKAREQTREALASLLPQLSLSGQYQYYLKVPAQLIPASIFGGASTGSSKYVTGSFTLPQTVQGTAQLQQTLYNGQFLFAIKAAKANTDIYDLQLKSSKEDIAYNVGIAYYNIQSMVKEVVLLTANLHNTEDLIRSTRLQLDNGIATKTDYNRTLVNRESARANLVNAEGQLLTQRVQLNFLMGKPLADSFEIETGADSSGLPDVLPADSTSTDIRTDIRLLQAQKTFDEVEKKNIKAGYQPTLSLTQSYGTAGYNDQFQPFQTINEQWFKSNYISLSLSIPIYDGGKKRSQMRQKDIELQQYDAKIELNRRQADKETETALINYHTYVTTLRAQYANVDLAARIYTDRQLQFENGIVSLKDVLDANNDLISAQNTFISSLINTRTAELDLKKARGQLLEKNQ